MIIIVCGGRHYRNRNELFHGLDYLHKQRGPITLLIHGKCPTGADMYADIWADTNGVPKRGVAANWKELHYSAGPIRNAQMADMKPNAVVAFSGGHGTHSMVRIARERGIEVIDLRTECPLTGKLRYQDREHAKRQLEVNRKQLNGGVDRRRENGAYECPKCGGWHLSSHYRHENTSGVDMRSRRG